MFPPFFSRKVEASCMHSVRRSLIHLLFTSGLLAACCASAQTISSMTPSSVSAGSAGFVLSVFGNDFSSGSVVRLYTAGGAVQTLPSYFVNSGLMMAVVPTTDLTAPAGLNVDV